MTREHQRQTEQIAWLQSGEPLTVGRLDALGGPDVLEALVPLPALGEDWYQLAHQGRYWLVRRPPDETQASRLLLLNDLQRRADLALFLTNPALAGRFRGLCGTTYGSLERGVIVMPQGAGEPVTHWDARRVTQWFATAVELWLAGFFEVAPTVNKYLDDGRDLKWIDYTTVYRFNPLNEFNPHCREAPWMHGAERFESGVYFPWLLQQEAILGRAVVLENFRQEKTAALAAYERFEHELEGRGASRDVLHWLGCILHRWREALAWDLEALYLAEGWRSHGYAVEQALQSRTVSPVILAAADWLLAAARQDYAVLRRQDALSGDDKGKTAGALIERYRTRRRQVKEALKRG